MSTDSEEHDDQAPTTERIDLPPPPGVPHSTRSPRARSSGPVPIVRSSHALELPAEEAELSDTSKSTVSPKPFKSTDSHLRDQRTPSSSPKPSSSKADMPLDRGAHAKGRFWFWASRLLGVLVIIAAVALLFGALLVAVVILMLGLLPALALSFRRGLAVDPHDVGSHETVNTIILRTEGDLTHRVITRVLMVPAQIGDVLLTFLWRKIRSFVETRFD